MGGVLYLHGFCSSSKSKKGQFLAARFAEIGVRATLPDLDKGDFKNTTISKQLKFVGDLAKEIQPAMLIGSSLGGYLAALHAAREPDTVPSLVLLAPAFDFGRRLRGALLGDKLVQWRDEGHLALYHYRYQQESPLAFAFVEDAMRFEAYPAVRVRTRVLHGLSDEVTPPWLTTEFASRSPSVEVEWLDADHSMVDVADQVWHSVKRFYTASNSTSLGRCDSEPLA